MSKLKIHISAFIVAMLVQSVAADDSLIKKNIELCNNKNNEACYIVGDAYFWGDGTKQDYKKANEYFEKACSLDHLISCSALTYMTPLLNKESPIEPPTESNLLNPQYFEYARTEISNINSDKFREIFTQKYSNIPKEKIDLMSTAASLLFADKRFAWVVYQDLKKNNIIKAGTSLEEFWLIFAQRANQIAEYLLAKYHHVLSDDELEAFISYNKQVFNALYKNKQYNTCKKIIFGGYVTQEESIEIVKEVSTELLKKKLRAESNLIKSVLYKNENELNILKNKYAYLDKPESDVLYRKLVEKSIKDYLHTLSKLEAASFVEMANKGNQADAQSLCKFSSVFFDKYTFNSKRDIKEKRLMFVKSNMEQIALNKTMSFIEDEIKIIKQDESIIDREYLSNQKITDEKSFYEQSCELKNSYSCVYLGILYETGNGVQTNLDLAINYYEKACNLNDGIGCYGAGRHFYNKPDLKEKLKALHLFEKTCDLNIGEGCVEAANQYHSGTIVANDSKYAKSYYEKACDLKVGYGCLSLGIMYEVGKRVPKNLALAKEYYEKGCKLGDNTSCYSISKVGK